MSSHEILDGASQANQPASPAESHAKDLGLGRGERARRLPSRNSVEFSSDSELIRRTGESDREAFEELYRRYARSVLGLAIRRLRDRSRAEDATQETFTAIWRSAATYRPERGPGTPWLYTVARNAIINQTRIRVEPTAEAPDSPSDRPGPPEHAESDWVSWRVHRALESLPEHERTVIELAYWSGLSQSEIAARVSIPLGTVKTRTRSALVHLAELFEHEGLDG
jgi:RNA polymerase sigma-70 factor (ECF subfamily)